MKPGAIMLGAVGLALGIGFVLLLQEATLSTHHPVAPDSRVEVIVSARTKGGERTQTLAEMVEAQLLVCRLEVNSDLVGPIESGDDGNFRAVLAPALDKSNERQFRGCLEDWVIDHFQLDVISLTELV